jgi:hypothetical protein
MTIPGRNCVAEIMKLLSGVDLKKQYNKPHRPRIPHGAALIPHGAAAKAQTGGEPAAQNG